jgi:hypothetical protein
MKFYKLTKTIDNPKPDRRRKFDWRADAQVPKGMKFFTVKRTGEPLMLAPVTAVGAKVEVNSALAQDMIDYMEEYAPKTDELLACSEVSAGVLLRKLVKDGTVDLDTLHEAIKAEHQKKVKVAA